MSGDGLSLTWAPGRDIVYQRAGKRNFSILASDGSESSFLTNDQFGWIHSPLFSADGRELAAHWVLNQPLNGAVGLFVFPMDGSTPREHRARRISGRLDSGTIRQSVDAAPYRGHPLKLVTHLRTEVTGDNGGQCWLRVDRPQGQPGFFSNTTDELVRTPNWTALEIEGKVDIDGERIMFGCFLKGVGRVWVDDVELSFKNDTGQWIPINVQNAGFEEADGQQRPVGWTAPAPASPGYTFRVTSENPHRGKTSAEISALPLTAGQFIPVGWAADGQRIYAYERGDPSHIVAIPVAGGPVVPFITLPVPAGRTVWESRMSPDGRSIAFTIGESRSDVRIITNFDPSLR